MLRQFAYYQIWPGYYRKGLLKDKQLIKVNNTCLASSKPIRNVLYATFDLACQCFKTRQVMFTKLIYEKAYFSENHRETVHNFQLEISYHHLSTNFVLKYSIASNKSVNLAKKRGSKWDILPVNASYGCASLVTCIILSTVKPAENLISGLTIFGVFLGLFRHFSWVYWQRCF